MAKNTIELIVTLDEAAYNHTLEQIGALKKRADEVEATIDRIGVKCAKISDYEETR